MMDKVFVSVIVPVRNEERYIVQCLESIEKQTYSNNLMEIMIIDGMSTDRTKEYYLEYKKNTKIINLSWHENEKKTAPCAMNIGIKKSKGDVIIRLDAHSSYEDDYIEKCVRVLRETRAANVGGIAKTQGNGNYISEVIAILMSSKFGVGNSSFRTNGSSGYVDTVPFGAFRRDIFDKVGLYDERLVRNQDIELNYRIRKSGEKVYLSSDINLTYYSRNTFYALCRMAYNNGLWNIITQKLCPGSLGARHFIPLLFVLSIIIGMFGVFCDIEVIRDMFLGEFVVYFILSVYFAINDGWGKGIKYSFPLILMFLGFHVSYGVGSIVGLVEKRRFS